MISIQDVMTADHKRCDALYAKAELYASNNDWDNAQVFASNFIDSLLSHFQHEENILFPAFEEVSGMRHGPTEMMRHEHEQMRALLVELEKALENKNRERYIGLSETLLIYMQQHNMKEEQILYPMIDSDCTDMAEELTKDISSKADHAA
ncbi:MAG: hemerythrin domain-containing protein [Methylococcales bacterium]